MRFVKKYVVLGTVLIALFVWQQMAVSANESLQAGDKIQLNEQAKLIRHNKVVGTLPKDAVVKFLRFENKHTRIEIAGMAYLMNSQNVRASTEQMSIGNFGKTNFPIELIAKKSTNIVDANDVVLKTIQKGEKLTLQGINKSHGLVNYLNGSANIKLTDFHYINLVNGAKNITYDEMQYKLQVVSSMYPSITKLSEIGASVEGRTLYSLTVGTGKKQILMDASFHGREHMTTNVLMEMIDEYVKSYVNKTKFSGYNVHELLQKVSIVFVPMVNPDGVTLAQGGKVSTSKDKLVAINNGSTNFDRWKANINGVDLNRQFDVNWHLIEMTKPSFKEYKGTAVYTEPEAIAMKRLIDQGDYLAYIAYHSSGQIIYWGRPKTQFERTKNLVKGVSKLTGYQIMPVTKSNEPIAASEDYFTKTKDRPAMTIEIAPFAGEATVPLKHWNNVWKRNAAIGLYVAAQASKW